MTPNYHDGALLAGVCATLAHRLGWSVWALRALFVLGLFIQAIVTGVVYILLAVLLPKFQHEQDPRPALKADELRDRNRRINELERRFREMEQGPGK